MSGPFTVIKNGLVPQNVEAQQELARHKVGDTIEIDILDARDAKHERYIFMVIGRLARALATDPEEMRAQLLIATGRGRMLRLIDDRRIWVIPSMDKRAMKHADLLEFWNDVREMILNDLMPKLVKLGASHAAEMTDLLQHDPTPPPVPEKEVAR